MTSSLDPERRAQAVDTSSPAPKRRALSVDEFAQQYGVGRSTAYNWMREGKLRTVKVGGRRLIPVDVAEALLAADDGLHAAA